MKVDVEKLSNVEIKVAVEVPADAVDRALDKQYRELARSVTIRGFRKGKAPRGLLERRFGKEIEAETARTIVGESIEEALKDLDDKAIGEPVLENEPVEKGKPFTFHLRLETRPEFEPTGYKELTLPPVETEASDAEVDERLETLRQSHASLVPADEGAKADTGHVLVVDFEGRKDDVPFPGGTAEDASIELGSGRMIPGFEDELVGAAEGETRTFDITFPEDYGNEDLAGQKTSFTVTVKEIKRKELPALDDEFARDQGADDLAALKERIRDEVAREKEQSSQQARDKALVDQLIEKNPFDVPPRLLESRMQQRMHDLVHRLEHAGHDHDQAHRIVESQAEMFRTNAERELREHFILRRIADTENIEVSEEDVDAYLQKLAEATRMPIAQLKQRLVDGDAQAGIESELRERKVREAIVAWSTGETPTGETSADETPADDAPADDAPADDAPAAAEEPTGDAAPDDAAAEASEEE